MSGALFYKDAKDPTDVDDWILDLSGTLAAPGPLSSATTYNTIAGTPTLTVTPNDMTASNITVTSGAGGANTAVGYWLTGGTAGGTYQIAVAFTASNGDTFTRSVYLRVASL